MEKYIDYFKSAAFISSVVMAVGFYVAWVVIKKLFNRYRSSHSVNSILTAMYSAIKYILFLTAALLILEANGVNINSLIAGVGIASLTIGLALQDALKDIIMGIHLMSEKYFDVGDVVEIDGQTGLVTSFSIRSTRIKSLVDNSVTTISNRDISKARVMSHLVDIDVPLSYEDDYKQIHSVMQTIAERIAEIPRVESCIYKGTQRFEESSVIYKIRYFAPPEIYWDTWRAAIAIVQEGLAEAGLKIPYNQLDIHQK